MSNPILELSLPGVRVLLVGTATHKGDVMESLPGVLTTIDDLKQTLVDRCGLQEQNLRTLPDPEDPQAVRLAVDQAARDAEDTLLLYYVGHGLLGDDDRLYLATASTDHPSVGLSATALPYSFILEAVRNSPARSVVVVLDCCFSGRAEVFERLVSDPFAMAGVDGRYLLASSGQDELALAPEGERHTTFTGELLRLLNDGDPRLPQDLRLEHLYQALCWRLPRKGAPEPRRYLSGGVGDLVLARNPAAGASLPPQGTSEDLPATLVHRGSPYRGLDPFDARHADAFYGRETLTDLLVRGLAERLPDAGPLVVIGPSGSGKSSLLQAGLVPALWRGGLDVAGSTTWPCHTITPGSRPLETLARRFHTNKPFRELTEQLLAEPSSFASLVRQWLRGRSARIARPGRRLVLIVDQFEEIFTACHDEQERTAFLHALVAACTSRVDRSDPPALVVIAVRADFYGDCLKYSPLVPALQDGQVVVGPMTQAELRDAIEKPAAAVNLNLEDGLVDRLLEDLSDGYRSAQAAGGALPLLSFALMATWGRRARSGEGETLTLAGYQATGGIREAVAKRAEEVYTGLPQEVQGLARRLLLRMVRVGDGSEDTRRRVDLEEIREHSASAAALGIDGVIKKFSDARLVTLYRDHAQITHEALLYAWPRLRQWIDADRAGLLVHQQLTEATSIWLRHDRDASALLRGARLTVVREWAASDARATRITDDEQEFLDASVLLHDRELAAAASRAHRRRQAVAALAILLIASLAATGVAIYQNNVAMRERQVAEDRLNEAESRQIAAVSREQRTNWPVESQLLAAAAWRNADTEQARSALLATQTHPLRRVLKGHTDSVLSMVFSRDGQMLATGGRDKTVRLWETSTGRPIGRPLPHDAFVSSITFSPDGNYLSTGTVAPENAIRTWEIKTGQQIGEPIVYQRDVLNLRYSPDNALFVTNIGRPVLTDAATGEVVGVLDVRAAAVDVQFSGDGRLIATSETDKTIRLWRVSDQQNILTIPVSEMCRRVALSPDGSTVACPDTNLTVSRWDTSSGRRIGQPLREHTNIVEDVTFGANESVLATASDDKRVLLWYFSGGEIQSDTLVHADPVWEVEFSPDGGTLAAADKKGTITLWQPLISLAPGTSDEFTVTPDGRTVAFYGDDGTVRLWDTATRKTVGRPLACDPSRPFAAPVFSPNGQLLAVTCNGELVVLDAQTGRQVAHLDEHPSAASFSPDGRILAVATIVDCAGNACGKLILFDVETNTQLGEPLFHDNDWEPAPISVQFSRNGEMIATGSWNGEVRLWDMRSREQIGKPLIGHTGSVTQLAFSPDGRVLASTGKDLTIRQWDVDSRREIGSPLTGPTSAPMSLSFNPDGTILASAGWDNVVRLWRAREKTQLATLNEHSGIQYAQFTDQGDLVGLGAYNLVARWAVEPTVVLDRLCHRLRINLTEDQWEKFVPGIMLTRQCH